MQTGYTGCAHLDACTSSSTHVFILLELSYILLWLVTPKALMQNIPSQIFEFVDVMYKSVLSRVPERRYPFC